MSEYDPIQKAQDATVFAKSRFGRHYVDRLAMVRDSHYKKARSLQREGADVWRIAAEIARADETDSEIEYFAQAQKIATEPKLMDRIRKNLKRKEKADD